MATSKRKGRFGFARAATAGTSVAAPKHVLVCNSANITAEPVTYERIELGVDVAGAQAAGFNVAFKADGCEMDAGQLGYALWCALGAETFSTDHHVLYPGDPQYVVPFADRGLDLGTSTPTERAKGGMINSLSIDIQRNQFVKVSVGGLACDFDTPVAAIVAVAPAHPLSWHGLRAGDFKVGYNGAVVASDRTIKGIKIDYAREISGDDEITLDGDQPTALDAHGRTLDFELTRNFYGSAALAEYTAWKAQQTVGIEVELSMNAGGETVELIIPNARITGGGPGEVGSGNDIINATLKCRAFVDPTHPLLITANVKDAVLVAYT